MKVKVIAICIPLALSILFGVLLVLYLKDNKVNRELYKEKKITIVGNGETKEYTYQDLSSLCKPTDFNAIYKPSNKEPINKTYTGIELKFLLEAIGCDLENAKQIVFTAKDGLQKVYTVEDVLKENNVYIAYLVNGKPFNEGIDPLAYSKEQEDGGPYVVIKAEDKFSQNRVKLLVEIKIE